VGFESGQGTLEVVDGSAWQNHQQPYDVSGEGKVTPLDVLLVINYLNAGHGGVVPPVLPGATPPPPFYDVNGDGVISAQDVLVLINYLNDVTGSSGGGEKAPDANAEGESADAAAAPPVGQTFLSAEPLPAATPTSVLFAEPAPSAPDAVYPALETPTLQALARDTGRQRFEATLQDLALAEFDDLLDGGPLV
jgi:hypothetical protein